MFCTINIKFTMYLATFCVKSFTSACCGAMKKSNISLIDGSPKLQIGCQCCHESRLGINDKHNPQPCILIIINYFWQTCPHNDVLCKLSLIVWCFLSCTTFCCWSETMFIQLVSNHNLSIKSRWVVGQRNCRCRGAELCVKIGSNYEVSNQ